MPTEHKDIAEIYFHINNGGILFEVLQAEHSFEFDGQTLTNHAPVLRIRASHFGQETNGMLFQLSPEALQLLGETLIEASKRVTLDGSPMIVEDPRRVKFGNEVTELCARPVESGSAEIQGISV